MKISIITVCFNAIDTIDKTIESVINQTYSDIEYIIIDGKSTDGTVDIINKYSYINNFKYISEKDKGIYDAMNKGINLVTGDYIYFLNSGDYFCNEYVIEKIVSEVKNDKVDIIYGNIFDVFSNYKKHISYKNIKLSPLNFIRGTSIGHQAIFANKKIFIDNQFDIKYRICADKKWIISSYLKGYRFKYYDVDICLFDKSGVSCGDRGGEIVKNETLKILQEAFPVRYNLVKLGRRILNG